MSSEGDGDASGWRSAAVSAQLYPVQASAMDTSTEDLICALAIMADGVEMVTCLLTVDRDGLRCKQH
jgi:hypothetical protein